MKIPKKKREARRMIQCRIDAGLFAEIERMMKKDHVTLTEAVGWLLENAVARYELAQK